MTRKQRRITIILILLAAALLISFPMTVCIGSVDLEPGLVFNILRESIFGNSAAESSLWTTAQYHIVWNIRMPRILLGALAGAGLAVCGAVMQALVLNPIADPYVLGVSSGASAGAALALLTPIALFQGTGQVTIVAFIGALLAAVLVYSMSRLGNGTRLGSTALLISGTAVNAMMAAVTNLLIFLAKSPESISTVYYWQMGSIASAQWKTLPMPAIGTILGIVFLLSQCMRYNIMMMGDEDAIAMGINVTRFRAISMLAVALIVASLISVTGVIGFVGLIVPHIVRLLVKTSDNRVVMPCSVLLGALFLMWADAGARGLFGATEVPLGIVTAFVGAPFFVFLLFRQRKTQKGDAS